MGSYIHQPGPAVAGLTVRESTESDAEQVALSMQPDDQFECFHAGLTPVEATYQALEGLSSYTFFLDGKVYGGMFGLYEKGEHNGNIVGSPFLITTNAVAMYPKTFLAGVKRWLPMIAEDSEILRNSVWRGNKKGIALLRHLDFVVDTEVHRAFYPYYKRIR